MSIKIYVYIYIYVDVSIVVKEEKFMDLRGNMGDVEEDREESRSYYIVLMYKILRKLKMGT